MKEILKPLLSCAGLYLEDDIYEKLEQFNTLLNEANKFADLTNVPPEDMPVKHYADSLLIMLSKQFLLNGFYAIDVGTGAGFPGVPLAIANKNINFVLLDALKKRCDFLKSVKKELKLNNVEVIHSRVEDAAHSDMREKFDIALSRAVAPMNVLLEYTLPFVKKDGFVLCWKGPQLKEELTAAQNAVRILGGSFGEALKLPIPNRTHLVQTVKKIKSTPEKYPRRAGIPGKRPII